MRYTTTLIAALSGLTLLSGFQTPAFADGPKDKAKAAEKQTLADFLPDIKKPKLWIGSDAPDLSIEHFVKGEPIKGFKKGQVYVVEFWATWCGPCVAAFPHLSELQKEYGDEVRFIGVNIWERFEEDERQSKIEEFVADQADRMSYTVAIEKGSSMADNWMKPAGQNGIPAAFIVDADSKVAWIGHPGGLDKPLKAITSGEFDSEKAGKLAWEDNLVMSAFQLMATSIQDGENMDDARKIAQILMDNQFSEDPGGLNAIAWMILSSEAEGVGMEDHKTALKAITKACEMTKWKDWSMLDTYALACHKTGDTKNAIKWQKKAIDLAQSKDDADHTLLVELGERLSIYEEE